MSLTARIQEIFTEGAELRGLFVKEQGEQVAAAAQMLAQVLRGGGRVFIFGNGGSAADAQHLAAEFINRFEVERPPLAAVALTTDSSVLTSIANDYDFNEIFAKQLQGLGRAGDAAWGISTSGASPNVVRALEAARELGMKTLALTGRDGGVLAGRADIALVVRSQSTARIQEVHLVVGHALCDLVDRLLFPEKFS